MKNPSKFSKDTRAANCNLALMALLFALSGFLGSIGALIISIGYAFYTKYWKPLIAFIPIIAIVFLLIYVTVYYTDIQAKEASLIGSLLGLIPALVSFFLYRSHILKIRKRISSNN